MRNALVKKSILILAKDECPNRRHETCMLTGRPCSLLQSGDDAGPGIVLDCDCFQEHVMPPDWDLNDLAAYAVWYSGLQPDNREQEDK
ncbi:MAG: hypothetical protein IKM73_12400 [Acidaminococcaceae bacterium]|nr:hypothetical protein [Acidaminococcaceae bacterium]